MAEEKLEQKINLYSDDLFVSKELPDARFILKASLASLVVLLALSVLVLFTSNGKQSQVQDVSTQLDEQKKIHDELVKQLASRDNGEALEKEIHEMERKITNKENVVNLYREKKIKNSMGFHTLLVGLGKRRMDGVWLTHFSVVTDFNEMTLTGLTTDPSLVPLYLNALREEPEFVGRSFSDVTFERDKPKTPEDEDLYKDEDEDEEEDDEDEDEKAKIESDLFVFTLRTWWSN